MTNLSKVGKYEVQDLVGEGAMGVVYRAVDPMLNRSVAVKVMNDALALDDDFRGRFLREARAAGSLQHPNVVTVYDCGETEGHLYIAMEYVSGTDLEHLIGSAVPLALSDKLDIITGVLNGLAYAHKRGIVHRDMKPANIRVNEEGRALIMDFGIAHTSSSNMTKTGMILGTPNYMAPEQVTGGAITAQTDIFAVGVVLYELLTNVRPFEGDTLHSVLFKIVDETPVSPDILVKGLRPDLADIVMKALAKDPADRYATALEMANALSMVNSSIATGGTTVGARTMSLRTSIDLALRNEQQDKVNENEKEDASVQRARRRTWQRVGAAAVVVVAVATALVLRGAGAAPRSEPATAQRAAAGTATPPVPTPPQQPSPVATSSSTPTPPAPTPPLSAAPRAAAKSEANVPVTDMTLAVSLQTSAQQIRRRAVEAGASAAQLAAGDVRFAAGGQFIKTGQREPAMREFTQASSAFGDAESVARAASAAAAATASAAAAREQAKAPPPAVVANTPPPVQPAPAPPASNPSNEIAAVVSQYAKAIESRDVAELKRLNPGMSSAQASSFEDFFRSVRSIRASFSVSNLQLDGTNAEARLNGAYDFVTSNGKSEHQPLTLQASLRKDGGGWRILSIK